MNIPCKFSSPCIDPANPVANTSAELPDPDFFFGYNSWWSGIPPLDSIWSSVGCISQCLSSVSQSDADVCAANQNIICAMTDGGGNHGINDGGGWINPVTGTNYPPTFNDPESCTVFCPDGLPFVFTVPAGTIIGRDKGQADGAALSLACAKARNEKVCLGDLSAAEACINSNYSGTITATGNTVSGGSNMWSNPGGGLPPGISLSFAVGGPTLTLSGKPIFAGNYTFFISVQTPNGDFMSKQFTICVVDISPPSLPQGSQGTPYSQTLLATCGQAPLNWQVTSGALPVGLSLDQSTGIISGIPTQSGTFNFAVTLQTAAT